MGTLLSQATAPEPAAKPSLEERLPKLKSATVGLVDEEGNIYCTGVFINSTDIVTAQHCLLVDDVLIDFYALVHQPVIPEHIKTDVRIATHLDFVMQNMKMGRHATVMYTDDNDLALLRLVNPTHHAIVTVGKGEPEVGSFVDIVGHTVGLAWSYDRGMVSFNRRQAYSPLAQKLTEYLQVVSSINVGNSGGGLFDENGSLVGIASFIASDAQVISFSLDASEIRAFLKKHGVPYTAR